MKYKMFKTEQERNEGAKQYLPLVKKISNQLRSSAPTLSYDDIEGYGWKGFVDAMNKYNPEKSKLSFQQYAAWSIRNAIFNGMTEACRTIKVSYYIQQKMKERGENSFKTVSIDVPSDALSTNSKGNNPDHYEWMGILNNEPFDHPIDDLVTKVKDNFSKKDSEIFFKVFGLDGNEEMKSKDIAKQFSVSPSLVTVKVKKIINFIKQDHDLVDSLGKLMN